MKDKIRKILCLPRSLLYNCMIFPLKVAIKIPVLFENSVSLSGIRRNCIEIEGDISSFMIKFGFGGSKSILARKSHIFLEKNCRMIFKEKADFGPGVRIVINNNNLYFGKNFYANKNLFLSSDNNIVFKDDVLIGWNVNIRDTDGHKIISNKYKQRDEQVVIGNHVWICAYVDILKNTKIGDDCVIGYRSCCTGLQSKNNQLICGYPAKVIKENINWKK